MNGAGRAAIAGATAAAAVGVAVFQGQYPTAQRYGATIHRERAAGRRIALTYDDGPNPEQTPRLLELLARHDAKATFFLIGEWAEREPALIRRARRGGSRDRQPHLHPSDDAGARRQADPRGAASLPRGGRGLGRALLDGRRRRADAPAVRAPAARHAADDARGGLRPRDVVDHRVRLARHTTAKRITRRCLRAKDGDIILLHDGCQDGPAVDRSKSIESTEAILEHFSPQGYRFVTVPELVAAAR